MAAAGSQHRGRLQAKPQLHASEPHTSSPCAATTQHGTPTCCRRRWCWQSPWKALSAHMGGSFHCRSGFHQHPSRRGLRHPRVDTSACLMVYPNSQQKLAHHSFLVCGGLGCANFLLYRASICGWNF
ncbi:hypothetical protein SEVIR_8G218950v4 [Setaria viridis]